MNEPSVLDYVIAKIRFWEKSNLHLPPAEERDSAVSREDGSLDLATGDAAPAVYPAIREQEAVQFPWLAFAPFGAAIVAQFFLEPPNRAVAPAAIFYIAAFGLTLLAFRRGYLYPADHAPVSLQADDMSMHWGEALIAVPIAAVAFILFGQSPFTNYDNRFTLINVGLWATALGLFLYAFILPRRLRDARAWLRLKIHNLLETGLNIHITGFTVLLILVVGITLFFRFYRLDQLPIDMVSDHAEKLLDINDVINGIPSIFFVRNTGREPFQFYWTVLVMKIFNLPVSFYALKLGTVLIGLITCYYTYRLAGLVANRWVALLALLFVGVAYWPNIISRIALRFPLYPFFVAPLLFYLIRGLRNSSRNDFIWAGIWLGIGLNGYTSSRIVPFLVVIAVVLYLLHRHPLNAKREAILGFLLVAFFAVVLCLPLIRYGLEHPDAILFRSLTRIGNLEHPIEGSPVMIFLNNLWAAVTMFFYSDGMVWVHSIPYRPALDIVMAALFFIGVALLLVRYVAKRDWEDALLLISVPVLLLPSALSIAFPGENPSLNRTSGAYVPVIIIAAMGLEALLRGIVEHMPQRAGRTAAALVGLFLVIWTVSNNYNLFFVQYDQEYTLNAWNTREIGAVVKDFAGLTGTYDTYYVVGFPYWVDSRQVAIFAGHIERDPGILPEQIQATLPDPREKLYLLKPEDSSSLALLQQYYPNGRAQVHQSPQAGKDFIQFLVPAR